MGDQIAGGRPWSATSPRLQAMAPEVTQADDRPRRSRRRRIRRSDDGAALVEFALILPVLMMLVLGLFSGGQAYNQKLDMTHAAREGSRYGATIPTTQTWVSGTWQSNIRDYVVQRSAGTLSASQVCVALVQGATPSVVGSFTTKADGTPCLSNDPYPSFNAVSDPGRRVQVRVERPGSIDLGVLPSFTFTMTARAVTKSETSL